ncbi:shikimate kinase [Enterococcus saccharolyticus]|uniref:Shikimate kinase n=1 Tax=Candidatus Enterococcus willemsii TaxID=1857215 RepID=A0ABQ6YWF4_9ENTE|nr:MULTISPECIES: shikimate kinase [Enterococcus]KAF1301520.1 shikimate kinase [Enterococcus sp. CU12B]MCD5003173.1 shikimate kinase [Enterococcus saccharolyticus]
MKNIVLIGFMGAGKTTIGQLLATKLNWQQYDLDQVIVEKIGMSIADYFDKYGSEAFRNVETQVLQESHDWQGIISTGGGIILKEENRQLLQEQPYVVYLKADLEELIRRVKQDEYNVRPLADSKTADEVKEVYLPRVPLYEESASHIIDTTGKSPEEIVQEILNQVGE